MAIFGFIGTGNMGGALARALRKNVEGEDILLANRSMDKAAALAEELGCKTASNEEIAKKADYIFLGVKPQMMAGMLSDIAPVLKEREDRFILVTMAAGLTIARIRVLSGCINLSGVLTIRAESEFASSTVARILDLMDSASEGRSNTESLITRFAQVYTPAVVYAALALAFVPPLFTGFDFGTWIHRALNFLVVSCP